jgi:beta-galactosidase
MMERNSDIIIWLRSYFVLLLFILFGQFVQSQSSSRIITDFNEGWNFHLGNDSLAFAVDYNDGKWRVLNLPHDWSIEGDFSERHPATTQGGALPGGIGWYRKSFILTKQQADASVFIEFDGVYRNSEVWINGHYLGKRPYGYSSFQYELTPHLNASGENIIAVKVDNSQQPNSRWYTGSGIYRNVRLVTVSPEAHIAHWGNFITTPVINEKSAKVSIATQIESSRKEAKNLKMVTSVYDARNKLVSSKTSQLTFAGEKANHREEIIINKPQLWSVDRPYLYKATTRIMDMGKVIDEETISFGIRYFRFDPDKGFFLNGKYLKILGVCNHHDLGALGAAINKRAIERQLQILKEMGCNAIRTAHNPPAPELLDLCDKMGFLVMDEAFDMWRKKKNKFDYFSDFDEWHKRDLEDMVLRDRNHPSVFMWSVGNEIREQFDSTGITITRELVSIIKAIDTTRPVTAALSEWNPAKNFMYKSGALDVLGFNYHHEVYDSLQIYYPGKALLGAENMSALATRGHYDLPSDSAYHWPAKSPQRFVENGNPDFTVSAYDQVSAYWGSTHEETWKIIKRHDYLAGLFVWTGFDYLGEPTPYPWPARSSYFGIIDLAGFPKDAYYMYQSEWTSKPVLHLFPHWNWKEGQLVDVWAYYNNADEVELFLNGHSQGIRKKEGDALHVMWRVPFQPGTIKAVSRKNGKTVLQQKITTAGSPAKIELIADRKKLKADGRDLSFITVRILDKDNNLVPDASNIIKFSFAQRGYNPWTDPAYVPPDAADIINSRFDGTGYIIATDNGYQASTEYIKTSIKKAWKGKALVIVRAGPKKGNITLWASAEGLETGMISLETGE